MRNKKERKKTKAKNPTVSMEQTPSEADICSASQVIPRHLDCKDH
jgi:hypothetical protein